ncbi:MAG: pyridoxamine 5'-phosphate oxidase family protein [Bacillales bacterium]|jgi:uncharacterized pyridoxamine 5'-phosphate oxidase family protein|nr:pyridoxamine 5'-phosphate oxidase family protein [Bacillales bacterium]
MDEIFEFIREADVFYLATVRNGKASIRPFGVIEKIKGKLYIATNTDKEVYKDLINNKSFAINAVLSRDTIRVNGTVIEHKDEEIREIFFSDFPYLSSMYSSSLSKFVAFELVIDLAYIEKSDHSRHIIC